MNKLLITAAFIATLIETPAFAADMPLKAPPPPPFSWTGFYIGGEFGGAWANGHVNDSLFGLNVSSNHDGWLGGGVVGWQSSQASNLVFGIEADFDGTSLNATGSGVAGPRSRHAPGICQDGLDYGNSCGPRGFAADRSLFYIKGGGGCSIARPSPT